jgi:hypothetical protein
VHDRQLERLTRIFTAILTPLVTGCVAEPEPEPEIIDEAQFSVNLCDQGLRALALVEPVEPVDYLELRMADALPGEEAEPTNPSVIDSTGTRCAGASDVAACEAAFAALPLGSEFLRGDFDWYTYESLAFTRGDAVEAVGTEAALLELLGEIDSPGDAAVLARLRRHSLVCNAGNEVGERDDGYVIHTRSGGGCGEGDDIEEHVILVRPDGTIEVLQTVLIEKGDPHCSVGRLPAGLCRPRRAARARSAVGSFFAEVATLEAAAVTAFGQLARELALHGAPRSMIGAALRSRRDEIRHARATARLARRHGGRPAHPRVAAWAPRRLTEVAADNAIEGCIRETYGALVAHAQARMARDPEVRRVLAGIAVDETRHAALSWALADWARTRMSPAERRHVTRSTGDALERMAPELTRAWAPEVHAVAGLPQPDQAAAMFRQLREHLAAAPA